MIAALAPLAVVICALALFKRRQTRMASYSMLALALALAMAAGGYTVGKDLAKRDNLAQSAQHQNRLN